MSRSVSPRPDLPDGQSGPPPATWKAIEAIPVFLLALAVTLVLSIPVLTLRSCSSRFIGGTLVGEVGFGGAVLLWIRYVNHGRLAALGLPRRPFRDVFAGVAAGAAMIVVAGIVLAAPLGEEIFFRGFLYKGLRRRLRVWSATAISAGWFALVHFSGVEFLLIMPSLFVIGAGLALIYERRQSLLASIAAHATFNLVGYLSIALTRR